ncbi:lysylphosphatidylglycerol synthase transmembrane domain-containing protein [Actinomadura sp. DC4]|uniref:lysylphosphatidylglycerol synthase transmembrane domain-containing protein n=1 Tax=Actinomadura sp. DC4 TaxID=3055069 RepID=UPI0025B21EB5|nr:lysylphosphatidylglycerol synthase transmembrane domain-containing protein [Actinomadura sp. DC4]MDN3358777.1 lysylphosphatidylglycerol synthase transmembrane domain-containing protein [Actinomadura sp. DC4]
MKRLWPWLRILIGIGILALLVWRLGSGAFLDGLRVIDGPAILAALAIGLVTTVASAARWCLVVRRLGLRLSLWTAVADYYRSVFLNTVLPGGILGDVHRAVRHGQDAGDVGRGVRAVVIERTGGQVVLALAGVAVLLARPGTVTEVRHAATPVAVAVLCAGVVALIAAIGLARRTGIWRRLVTPALTDVRRGLLARDTWPGVMGLSAVGLAGHLALFLISARVAGSAAPATRLLPLMVLALFAMGLPVNIGGWGPREGATAWAFGAAGLGAAQGVTVAVVYGVLTFVSGLPGAAVPLLGPARRASAPAVRTAENPAHARGGEVVRAGGRL